MTSTYKETESPIINLYQAAHCGDIVRAKEALKRKANINHVDGSILRLTPLLAAVARCNCIEVTLEGKIKGDSVAMLQMIKFLIDKGADESVQSSIGMTYKDYLSNLCSDPVKMKQEEHKKDDVPESKKPAHTNYNKYKK